MTEWPERPEPAKTGSGRVAVDWVGEARPDDLEVGDRWNGRQVVEEDVRGPSPRRG